MPCDLTQQDKDVRYREQSKSLLDQPGKTESMNCKPQQQQRVQWYSQSHYYRAKLEQSVVSLLWCCGWVWHHRSAVRMYRNGPIHRIISNLALSCPASVRICQYCGTWRK
jgi:hypothetical protein